MIEKAKRWREEEGRGCGGGGGGTERTCGSTVKERERCMNAKKKKKRK